MKYFLIGFLFLTSSCFADFYVQYDDQGNILATVFGKEAPIVKNGRKQISFDKEVNLDGKMLDLPAVTDGKKYEAAKDYNSVTKDAPAQVQADAEVIVTP